MIIDMSRERFRDIFKDERLHLPLCWDGKDFLKTLKELLTVYQSALEDSIGKDSGLQVYKPNGILRCGAEKQEISLKCISEICTYLIDTVECYLSGFPAKAFAMFENVMWILLYIPFKLYSKNTQQPFLGDDPLKLYRVTCVTDYAPYGRSRVFHTPYNMRSKVSTSRFSIAGYPSLYLGTSLELCCEEIHLDPHVQMAIASRFAINRQRMNDDALIEVVELGVKPQDFFRAEYQNEDSGRKIEYYQLDNNQLRSAYLVWYPLIAACSFVRTNKQDPFAAEYIVPQLLMQWVRFATMIHWVDSSYDENRLIGIRYFSCASMRASDMGFNYVFPTSGRQDSKIPFCPILLKAFTLTKPRYLHDYPDVHSCERALCCDKILQRVDK